MIADRTDRNRIRLAETTSPEVLADHAGAHSVAPAEADAGSVPPVLLVPVGSLEQHGPHLPLDTDTRIACAVIEAAVDRGVNGVVAPSIAYGASGEHEAFAGTISIGQDALQLVLTEFGRSACRWTSRVAFVNGHGGNARALIAAVRLLRQEGREVGWFPCAARHRRADAHAGFTETSLLLHISPAQVCTEHEIVGNVTSVQDLMPQMRIGGVAAVSPSGVLGDATGANARAGADILADLAERLSEAVTRWEPDERGMLV
ncbi:mycofactocin biosynthesis peptidyl-dipeptidase MftE [Gordonia jinhuaensis]|uniref:Mycofactocin system creatininase family protein n=1 Tax=Gordonia jinhuaensis TaxID=1517702 RepID=A0A916WYX3_9ACTN|nr:mycofactocin system creatininase family protein [Gordonia jinhuaensis]